MADFKRAGTFFDAANCDVFLKSLNCWIPLYRKNPPNTRRPIKNSAFIAATSELLWIRRVPAMLPLFRRSCGGNVPA